MILGFSNILRNSTPFYYVDLPSFQRDFASLKTLDHGTGPNITFTRASSATFFDANGVLQTASNNIPRFDHDPATANSLGLLVENTSTNLHLHSEDFSTGWVATESLTQDTTVNGLDGAAGVGKWVCSTTDAFSRRLYASDDITTVSGTEYTFSVYLKPINAWPMVLIQLSQGTGVSIQYVNAKFDLSNGTVSNVATGTASIQAVGNGWYRCSVTSSGNLITAMRPKIILIDDVSDSAATAVTGVIDAGVYVWGAQLEAGELSSSYIPTTTATATRAAETPSVTPVSSFYNSVEGTLLCEATTYAGAANTRAIFALNDSSENNRNTLFLDDGIQFVVSSGGAGSATIDGGTISDSINKVAATYRVNDFAMSLNGGSVATDSLGSVPVGVTHAFIGYRGTGVATRTNGHIRKVAYWPKRLPNTLLQQLTT